MDKDILKDLDMPVPTLDTAKLDAMTELALRHPQQRVTGKVVQFPRRMATMWGSCFAVAACMVLAVVVFDVQAPVSPSLVNDMMDDDLAVEMMLLETLEEA